MIKNIKKTDKPYYYVVFILALTVIYSCLYNLQIFRNQYPPEYFAILLFASVARDAVIWYVAALNRWVFLVFTPALFAFGAGLDYFVRTLKIGIGIGVFELVFQTNIKEAVGVINPALVTHIILGVIISAVFVAVRFYVTEAPRSLRIKAALLMIFIVFVVLGRTPDKKLQEVKFGKGANTERGLSVMPEKILENCYHYAKNRHRLNKLLAERKAAPLPSVTYNDVNGGGYIVVFILTDALRRDHMQINGYDRETTSNMVSAGFISFADMLACETSTTRSVPCLMTRASRKDPLMAYLSEPSVLLMFRAAGFDTAWLSSQSSISTSDAGPTVVASDADYTFFNDNVNRLTSSVYDSDLLPELDKFLARPNPKKAVVLHLNGSHWPYNARYTPEEGKWSPDCSKWVYDCSLDEVINAYDNTVSVTDKLTADIIKRIKDKDAIIFFTSDHGQFLGEYGRRIHSFGLLEYKEVGVVPFAVWLSDSVKNNPVFAALEKNKDKITSHDNIFHSVTDCAGLLSPLIDKNLSVCSENLRSLAGE